MTTVEHTLAASRQHMTVSQIAAASELSVDEVRHALAAIAESDRIDCIPARGHHAARYALKNPAAMAEAPAGGGLNNSGSDASEDYAEGVAVATENPEPEADSHLTAEGSGRNVFLEPELQYLAPEDYEMPEPDPVLLAKANRMLSERVRELEYQLELAKDTKLTLATAAYLVRIPKRKPVIRHSHNAAVDLAMAAARNGAGMGMVFALVHVGTARRGAEWAES